jgi:hypothetical protein
MSLVYIDIVINLHAEGAVVFVDLCGVVFEQ